MHAGTWSRTAPRPGHIPSQIAFRSRLGGGFLKGISKSGEIVWPRIHIEKGKAKMDLGRAEVTELPARETQRRWDETTSQWPTTLAVTWVNNQALLTDFNYSGGHSLALEIIPVDWFYEPQKP